MARAAAATRRYGCAAGFDELDAADLLRRHV